MGEALAFLFLVGLVAVIYLIMKAHENNLSDQGLIIIRKYNIPKYKEIFTISRQTSLSQIYSAIEKKPYDKSGASMTLEANRIYFKERTWNAELIRLKDRPNGNQVYQFKFNHWTTRNGSTEHENRMNILLTQVEKALLDLDPNTKVNRVEMATKSHIKIL